MVDEGVDGQIQYDIPAGTLHALRFMSSIQLTCNCDQGYGEVFIN